MTKPKPKPKKLLPCPFCGRKARYSPVAMYGTTTYVVECSSVVDDWGDVGVFCGAATPHSGPRAEIRAWWNRRPE